MSQLIQSVINLLELSENTYLSTYLPTYIFSVTTYIQYGTYIHTYLGTVFTLENGCINKKGRMTLGDH